MENKGREWFEYLSVERPGRYAAREWNAILKEKSGKARIILAFPDVYEIGMSYHGFRILYERINSRADFVAERVFAPWLDAEEYFNRNAISLSSLETGDPLNQFDIIGFTLQHELSYSNILTMLSAGGVPLRSSERSDIFPLVIGGGAGALSPEPLADFFDAFIIGDGEDAAIEILETVRDFKTLKHGTRDDMLWKLKDIPGVYVPSLYAPEYAPDKTLSAMNVTREGVPDTIRARRYNIALDKGPVRPIAPNLRIVQERLVIESRRGCVNGCRFCQAGMINRPVRERPVEQILEIARCGVKNTGYEEISLLALSTADYSQITRLLDSLNEEFAPKGVNLSLPSIRINSCDVEMISSTQTIRHSGLTLAPEAGTERLRRIINKPVNDATLLEIIERAFALKKRTLKLYFMIGLPTETREDLDGIIKLIEQANKTARGIKRGNYVINITLSPFVPKAHTPFQWEGQCEAGDLEERVRYIKNRVRSKKISIKSHNIDQSYLEAVFARGDRRLGKVLLRAWEKGCRFDSWEEAFRPDLWKGAFEEIGVDPEFYANRKRMEDERFPWDHIHAGVDKSFLKKEWKRGLGGELTPDCVKEGCQGCGACEGKPSLFLSPPYEKTAPRRSSAFSSFHKAPVQRLRVTYAKKGALCLVSHLDLGKTIRAIFNRAEIPMAFTQGFNPLPKAQYGPPLSLGYESEGELIDLFLSQPCDPKEILSRLAAQSPSGLEFMKIEEAPVQGLSLGSIAIAADYEIILPQPFSPQILSRVEAFAKTDSMLVKIPKKSGWIERDLKKSVVNLEYFPVGDFADKSAFEIRVLLDDKNYVDPRAALICLLNLESSDKAKMRVVRKNILLKKT